MNLSTRLASLSAMTSALSLFPGCASLTPYEEIVTRLPSERLIEIGGRRIHVEQRGSGEPLLLLHGFAASTYSFRDITPLLAEPFRVVAIDLNGFGFTERPEHPDAYTPAGQLETVTGVMDALGIERCAVAGHSYGAALALLLAAREPERVRGLALISPSADVEKPPWYLRSAPGRLFAYGMVRALLSRPEKFREILGNAFHQEEKLTPEVAEAYRERLLVEGLPAAFRGFSDAMQDGNALAADLVHVRSPTLVVAGRHDAVVSLEHCRRVADTIPNTELLILENSGHSGPEEEPEAVAAAITRLFESTE